MAKNKIKLPASSRVAKINENTMRLNRVEGALSAIAVWQAKPWYKRILLRVWK